MRFSRPLTVTAAGALLTGAVLAATAGPASAYDCFNASRSAQGNASAAANSANWYSVPEFLAVIGFTPEQVATAMPAVLADPRVPAGFTVFFNEHHPSELASKLSDALATNGKGIDHSDDYGTPVLDAVVEDVTSALFGG